jgi:hypothetical protein
LDHLEAASRIDHAEPPELGVPRRREKRGRTGRHVEFTTQLPVARLQMILVHSQAGLFQGRLAGVGKFNIGSISALIWHVER